MRFARASSVAALGLCLGCNAEGLLLVSVDRPADDIEVALFEDPQCNAVPFLEPTAVTRQSFDTSTLGNTPQIGLFVRPTWHERTVRVEVTTAPTGYACVCVRLPGGGDTRSLALTLSDQQPVTCGGTGPGDDGGARGDSSPGDPLAGDPVSGDPVSGDPTPGDPTAGDPTAGDPTAGDPIPGDPSGGVYATPSWNDTIGVVVFYGVVAPAAGQPGSDEPRLRYQLLQGSSCGTTGDWSRPVEIDCQSECDDVHALSVSPMVNGRILVAVQRRDTAARDKLVSYLVNLTDGTSIQQVPAVPYIDPQPTRADVYPYRIGTTRAGSTLAAVASTCDADLTSSCGVRFWTVGPSNSTMDLAAGLGNPMRWLRVAGLGAGQIAAVGIDGSDIHGAFLNASGNVETLSRDFSPTFPPRSANPDLPSVDITFLPGTGDMMVLFYWTDNAGTANPELCPYLYDPNGNLQDFSNCIGSLPGTPYDLTAATNSNLARGDRPVGVVARAGNSVFYSAWTENGAGTWAYPDCSPDKVTVAGTGRPAGARRSGGLAARTMSLAAPWAVLAPRADATVDRVLVDDACTLDTWADHDDGTDVVLDLELVGETGPWLSTRRGPNALGSVTLVTDTQSEACLPQWSLDSAAADRLVPLGVAVR